MLALPSRRHATRRSPRPHSGPHGVPATPTAHCPPPTAHCLLPTAYFPRGLTLIEMLMATAITLLMMAAVVTLFANLSGSISNRRALIELTGQLRQVRQRLARDLAGCTVPPGPGGLTPWHQRPGEAVGYFEIIEGGNSDARPSRLVDGINDPSNNNFEINYATSLVPSGGDPLTLLQQQRNNGRVPQPSDVTNGGALGDADDVLAMTVRSLTDPFVANIRVRMDMDNDGNLDNVEQKVESNVAEVFWYAFENRADDPNTPEDETVVNGVHREPGMRTIYRRIMVIAPWLPPFPFNDRPRDVSVHLDPTAGPNDSTTGFPVGAWIPNTLADLTRREYRSGHVYNPNDLDQGFPHPLVLQRLPGEPDERQYVVLDNALAFDVRVLDPGAPLYATPSGTVLEPADPAWLTAIGGTPSGYGAYVDLGWNDAATYLAPTAAPPTLFQFEHQVGWHPQYGADPTLAIPNPTIKNRFRGTPAVYDTWTWHYETDGLNQDRDFQVDALGNPIPDANGVNLPLIDEGTNGRDDFQDMNGDGVIDPSVDIAINGVDDPLERETSPPYPVPLRAVRIILRMYEPDARQIREASVTNSFVP